MALGDCQTRNEGGGDDDKDSKDLPPPLDDGDIALLKSYGVGPYAKSIKAAEADIAAYQEEVKKLIGIKESDTGLSQPSQWDLVADKQMMQVRGIFNRGRPLCKHHNTQQEHRGGPNHRTRLHCYCFALSEHTHPVHSF